MLTIKFDQDKINKEMEREILAADIWKPDYVEHPYYIALRQAGEWIIAGWCLQWLQGVEWGINFVLPYYLRPLHTQKGLQIRDIDAIVVAKDDPTRIADTVMFTATVQEIIDVLEHTLNGLKGK